MGRTIAVELFRSTLRDQVAVSAVSCGEILEGMQGEDGRRRSRQFSAFLSEVHVLPVDQQTAEIYARERARLRSSGMLIPDNDLWIAATAIQHDLTLVSSDQHFTRIPNLQLHLP
jgi:tRNA(fMet)-specific endonuclease VapC